MSVRPGTTAVTVHLPAAKPSEAGTSPAGEGGTVAASRVLVVTEDVRFGEVLARALRRIGYRVDSATRIPDAARLHREAHEAGDRFALVLLGEAWREGDSPGAILTTLRSCDPAVRAVLLAVDGDEAKPAPVVAGFAGVLNRSFSIETLGAVMAKALQRG